MDNFSQYKPGLHKLVHHLDHLKKLQNREPSSPLHLSVFPTNFCQLECPYCGFRKVKRNNTELSFEDFSKAIDVLVKYGLKAMEQSGGGDPLLWSHFDKATEYAYNKGLKLSLVTNGLELGHMSSKTLSLFSWIRVSIQSEAYARKIDLSKIPNNIKRSMSFIVHDEKSFNELDKIHEFAKEKNILIRIAPNRPCDKSWANKVKDKAENLGHPFLFFEKSNETPNGCYMAWIRAALDWEGNFLPCPSIELTPECAGYIPDNFKLCKVSELEEWILNNPVHDLGHRCKFCNCGKDTNDFVYGMLQDIEDVDFV